MPNDPVAAVRHFNRFYTRQIGVLDEHLLGSPFSLTEMRVLYEVAQQRRITASEIRARLGLDAGYVSRIVDKFARAGLVKRSGSRDDRRQSVLSLTGAGRTTFRPYDARQNREVARMLREVPQPALPRLTEALRTVESLLTRSAAPQPSFTLRPPRPGDMGWVVYRHGALYDQEYGWGAKFEALVADIVARIMQSFDPERERCWIAEANGENVGSVFLVRKTNTVAKLRLLLVEPGARGLGIGKRLVEECIAFARAAGYRKITLWTQNNLAAARGIYRQAGFRVVAREPNHDFGQGLCSEVWELDLRGTNASPQHKANRRRH